VGGALVGGVIVGLAEVLGKLFLDPYLGGGFGEVFPLLVMVAVLLVRPYGLFGTERIERV
jgi:branched-chain amino acid transport system permease protein